MAALVVVDSSTPEQIQGWIDQVRKDVDPQVLTTLGEELVSEGHLPKAQYSKLATNGLQRGKLKGVLAGTGAHVHGIPCGAEWKVKADEWWETHGHIASNRFGDKLKHTAGGGMITEQVLNGQVLSQREGDTVVIDGKFRKLCEDLRNEDFAQVKAGIDPTASEFGKLFSRGARLFVAKIPMRILNVRASRGRTDWAGAGAGAGAEPELDSSMADGSCNCG
eukprot:COSAG06_NODE_2239_length_7271_cov_124.463190_4_plen_221_part_00